jgi:hypothetical protein
MDIEFTADVFSWRGPAPYRFVRVPADECAAIADVARAVTYGWGMVPVTVQVGETRWTTSLWPKDGGYLVPLRKLVQEAEELDVGDPVTVRLSIAV